MTGIDAIDTEVLLSARLARAAPLGEAYAQALAAAAELASGPVGGVRLGPHAERVARDAALTRQAAEAAEAMTAEVRGR